MKQLPLTLAVFAGSCVPLGWNLAHTGIASGLIDPVAQFGAQDEAVYTREAIGMVLHGDWMTPMLLGRPVFEKPPLLVWMISLSMKLFGISPLASRIPAVLAGALVCTICWSIAKSQTGNSGALLAAMLALTSQILFTMSRHAMTDVIMAAATLVSVWLLMLDPCLLRRSSSAGFTIAAITCLLVKSIGGLLPLGALAVFSILGRSGNRPRANKVFVITACALAISGIWFGYSYALFPEWFLADSGFQIFTVGSGQYQTSQENHVSFYLERLMYSDALTLLLVASALPRFISALRIHNTLAILICSYLGVYGAALLLFRFHSEQYLCWSTPLMIVTAVLFSPLTKSSMALALAGLSVVIFGIRITHSSSRWGIRTEAGTTIAAAPMLTNYCKDRRAVDLYVLDVDDEFYGMVLPLQRIRYGWIDPSNRAGRQHPYLMNLGVLLGSEDLTGSGVPEQTYRARLQKWGVDSGEAIGTGIVARDADSLGSIIRVKRNSDFLISRRIWETLGPDTGHRLAADGGDYILLESEKGGMLGRSSWRCNM